MISNTHVSCIVCQKLCSSASPVNDEDMLEWNCAPLDAVVFRSLGNYGSTVFDEHGTAEAAILVCDECFLKHSESIKVRRSDGEMMTVSEYNEKY